MVRKAGLKLPTSQRTKDKKAPTFAHQSEREFARILDFYQIDWEYEPRTFELQWDEAGNPTESFSPDFYLPEFDLFIELTTLRQSLVTKKNRKLRRLRELYPDINIKLFYNRDFKGLMNKYDIPVVPNGQGKTQHGAEDGLAGVGSQEQSQTATEADKENPSSVEEEGRLSPE